MTMELVGFLGGKDILINCGIALINKKLANIGDAKFN